MKFELSDAGLALIKSFEGLRLKAYKCVSSEKYYTIGYGHYGSDVKKDQQITKEKAEQLLRKDCNKFVKHVNTFVKKYPDMNQNQFDALVSFAYNVGSINQLTANGTRDYKTIAQKMSLYNKSGGKILAGLTRRREKERELFVKPMEGRGKLEPLRK